MGLLTNMYCKDTQVKSTALQIETADYREDLDVGKLTFIANGYKANQN